eukprot:TRINITY_DN22023_c0_g1_i1.p1 TRINITY_DN22023_c0_g1~~TRINITY_DN22023_c0_g1_i1.p1  ORF type:complete len:337 (-),score=64.97 TRINITY_DN22023_c0_g1_i1:177-1187(-)
MANLNAGPWKFRQSRGLSFFKCGGFGQSQLRNVSLGKSSLLVSQSMREKILCSRKWQSTITNKVGFSEHEGSHFEDAKQGESFLITSVSTSRRSKWKYTVPDPWKPSPCYKLKPSECYKNKAQAEKLKIRETLWRSLFSDFSQWEDLRSCKINSYFPDFKHKHTGEELWIDSNLTPEWVKLKLDKRWGEKLKATETLWNDLFCNFSEWRDLRRCKRNSNSPDFKHKETGEALWIDSTLTPQWVKPKLGLSDAQHSSTMYQSLENAKDAKEQLWKDFFTDPNEWQDLRNYVRHPKAPDFRHKVTGEGLWLDSKLTPEWVSSQIKIWDSMKKFARSKR